MDFHASQNKHLETLVKEKWYIRFLLSNIFESYQIKMNAIRADILLILELQLTLVKKWLIYYVKIKRIPITLPVQGNEGRNRDFYPHSGTKTQS